MNTTDARACLFWKRLQFREEKKKQLSDLCIYILLLLALTMILVAPDQLVVSKENEAIPLRSVVRFWWPEPDRYTGMLARGLLSGPTNLTWRQSAPQKIFKVKAKEKKILNTNNDI